MSRGGFRGPGRIFNTESLGWNFKHGWDGAERSGDVVRMGGAEDDGVTPGTSPQGVLCLLPSFTVPHGTGNGDGSDLGFRLAWIYIKRHEQEI